MGCKGKGDFGGKVVRISTSDFENKLKVIDVTLKSLSN